ncbi:flagellar hook-length control protein FliK [Cryobacterium sp. CG_9.6]|uniref:flagellar hook-length control protein FliK n=1 Tax=Cryobacterium sp. CG_9.6 TaxID=2760710 RepID=UPI002475430B|nr:flagellar hook-length control protein FliK [Cryobacterium sp. CG_9.6]MDH6237273.1 flagellar hook-length control protein FliK [Cryobacterium sp. CG_9.6]
MTLTVSTSPVRPASALGTRSANPQAAADFAARLDQAAVPRTGSDRSADARSGDSDSSVADSAVPEVISDKRSEVGVTASEQMSPVPAAVSPATSSFAWPSLASGLSPVQGVATATAAGTLGQLETVDLSVASVAASTAAYGAVDAVPGSAGSSTAGVSTDAPASTRSAQPLPSESAANLAAAGTVTAATASGDASVDTSVIAAGTVSARGQTSTTGAAAGAAATAAQPQSAVASAIVATNSQAAAPTDLLVRPTGSAQVEAVRILRIDDAVPTASASAVVAGVATGTPAAAPLTGAGPAASAVPNVPVPLATQVAKPLFTLSGVKPGEHVLTINVTPENLGPLTVRAHVTGDNIRVELFAPTDVAREALRAILPDLRRDLSGSGLNAQLDLSSQNSAGDARAQADRDQRPPPGLRDGPGDEPPPRLPRSFLSNSSSTIDVMA